MLGQTQPVPIDLQALGSDHEVAELIRRAQDADTADHQLTVRQALYKYRKAVAWAMALSIALVMEEGKVISPAWQSGLSNSSVVGQLAGLLVNGWAQDRFGARHTYMFFMCWMAAGIFIPFFATSLPVLAVGQAFCGISWGVFQTCSTSYASEVVPTVLRPYVTAFVCMCWGAGILLSSGVIRAMVAVDGNIAWRLPFALQWVWPVPLFLVAYFCPESPWNAVRRGKLDLARKSLRALRKKSETTDQDIEAIVAYIDHTTRMERAETAGASYLECFKGTNLRRTEINCVIWAAQILCGNAILGYSVVFLRAAGFSEVQAFNVNISLSACYIVGGIICWFLLARVGRATIYMGGLAGMLVCLFIIGGLGFAKGSQYQLAIGLLLVISTLINMITVGPACYPIVAETPSGKLRYKTITLGRFAYNLTGIFSNSLTPRMIAADGWGWGARCALFYAGTNMLCLLWCWFRLPETKDRSFGEIDMLFDKKVSARKFRSTKVDQFAGHDSEILAMSDEKKHDIEHVEAIA
ncbi:hypothetical protein IAU60_004753 [Kwoniella sp. DSM 27419]